MKLNKIIKGITISILLNKIQNISVDVEIAPSYVARVENTA